MGLSLCWLDTEYSLLFFHFFLIRCWVCSNCVYCYKTNYLHYDIMWYFLVIRCFRFYCGGSYSISIIDSWQKKFNQWGITVELVGEAQEDKEAVLSILKNKIQSALRVCRRIIAFIQCCWLNAIRKKLKALFVDEAHCV